MPMKHSSYKTAQSLPIHFFMVPWKQSKPGNSFVKLSINHSTTVQGTCLHCPRVLLGSPGLSRLLPALPSKGLGADQLLSGSVFTGVAWLCISGSRPGHVLG